MFWVHPPSEHFQMVVKISSLHNYLIFSKDTFFQKISALSKVILTFSRNKDTVSFLWCLSKYLNFSRMLNVSFYPCTYLLCKPVILNQNHRSHPLTWLKSTYLSSRNVAKVWNTEEMSSLTFALQTHTRKADPGLWHGSLLRLF